jgi:sugar transferase (PEP-CTERM/EpsH1 system associated)
VRHLARRHEVTVACLADAPADLENVAGLAPLVRAIDAVPLCRSRARFRALVALAAGTRPLTVAYFDEPLLQRCVASRVAAGEFDLALVCSSGMAQYVERYAKLPRVIQFSDLDSQKWRLYAEQSRFPRSAVYRVEAERLLRHERHIGMTFDCSLFCSARELEDFRRLAPGVPSGCVRNGVDVDYFHPSGGQHDPHNLVFTGVMNYRPNVEGVLWFCREVLPRVRGELPAATFTVCGSSPSRAIRALAGRGGVVVTGAVPDVRPYLARAAAAVVPVRIARGLQNKLLEAMAMGLPVVSTTAACAGVDADAAREVAVADDPAQFAAAIVALLRDPSRRAAMSRASRAAVETHYRWEKSLARLDEVLARAVARRRPVAAAV